jgi:hypothetical protein
MGIDVAGSTLGASIRENKVFVTRNAFHELMLTQQFKAR